jgi:hypothetical protein
VLVRERLNIVSGVEERVGIACERPDSDVAKTLPVVAFHLADHTVSFA